MNIKKEVGETVDGIRIELRQTNTLLSELVTEIKNSNQEINRSNNAILIEMNWTNNALENHVSVVRNHQVQNAFMTYWFDLIWHADTGNDCSYWFCLFVFMYTIL